VRVVVARRVFRDVRGCPLGARTLKGGNVAAKKKTTKKRKRATIRVGDYVKCVFREDPPRPGSPSSERMWLVVRSVRGASITGALDSKPLFYRRIKRGDVVTFPRSAVVQHWPKEKAPALAARAIARAQLRR
jgi:hypothetical protein